MSNNKNSIMISFCLPVYNVKKYISQCIDSILNQKVSGFEIICVDDCSTDGSYEFLQFLEKRIPELKVYRNEINCGVSYSRNRALMHSNGEYIWFVDPDDLLAPGSAQLYLDSIENVSGEVILGKCLTFNDGEIPGVMHGTDKNLRVDFSDINNFYQQVSFGCWEGLFKRYFLIDNNLFFREKLKVFEDITFYMEFGLKGQDIYRIDHYGYCYRKRKTSLSHRYDDPQLKLYVTQCFDVLEIFAELLLANEKKYHYTIKQHMTWIERTAILRLIRIQDGRYVREKMKALKKMGYYPYKQDPRVKLLKSNNKKQEIIMGLLADEKWFWFFYSGYRIYSFVRRHFKKLVPIK